MQFCANISTLFREHPFLDRFSEAKKYDFTAVEMHSPYEYSIKVVRDKQLESGLQIILLNILSGDNNGCASIPGHDNDFAKDFSTSLSYAFELRVQKLHILSGLKNKQFTEEDQLNCFITNLRNVAETLENHNIIGLIEPICSEVKENYFLDSFDKAVTILQEVNSPNIRLLLDIYHLKKIEGDASVETLQKYYGYAGHIQISQDPNRFEPFHPTGSIDFHDVFKYLKTHGYNDFIGLEYFSSESTPESLKWIENFH